MEGLFPPLSGLPFNLPRLFVALNANIFLGEEETGFLEGEPRGC